MPTGAFELDSAQRIVRDVKWGENFPKTRRGMPHLWGPAHAPGRYWRICKNANGATCPAYSLVAVTGVTTVTGIDEPVYTIDRPSTTFHRQFAVTGPDDIGAGDTGGCTFGPEVRFVYASGTPAVDGGWGPKPGQWTPEINYPAVLSVAGIVSATDKIALATLSPLNILIGKLAGALSVGSSATVNIWGGAGGSEAVITSLTVSGRDWLMKSGSGDIASGQKVVCQWINGIWYITEAECS